MTARAKFTQADITRILKAVKELGVKVGKIVIDPKTGSKAVYMKGLLGGRG